MRELVDRSLFAHLFDAQFLFYGLQLFISLLHGFIFITQFIDFILELPMHLRRHHILRSSLIRPLLLHEFLNSPELSSHFNNFSFQKVLLQLQRSVFLLQFIYFVRLIRGKLANGSLFHCWTRSFAASFTPSTLRLKKLLTTWAAGYIVYTRLTF